MKNSLTYYQHYSNSHTDPKLKLLRSLYGGGEKGWAAEGRFWALSSLIASSENCILKIHKKYVAASITIDLNFTFEEFDLFILRLTECELIINIDGSITIETIRENLKEVMKERERAQIKRIAKKDKPKNPLLLSLK